MSSCCTNFMQITLRLVLAMVLLISALFIPFLMLILIIIRKCVYLSAKLFRPDLKNFVQSASVIFAQEDILKKPKFNEVVTFVSDGHVELEEFRRIFHERLILKKKEPKGELYYPELKQFWTKYLTYLFWKDDQNFDLNHHVRLYDYSGDGVAGEFKIPSGEEGFCNEDDLRRVMAPLLEKPWKKGQSPWEMLLIQNFKSIEIPPNNNNQSEQQQRGATIGIFRFHHAMADGYSLSKLLLRDLMQVEPKIQINFPKMTMLQRIGFGLVLPFKLPWDLAGNLIKGVDGTNSWHGWGKGHKLSRKFYTTISRPIETQLIKDIKNKYGVGYNAVLCAAVAGGCQRVMEEAYQPVPKQMTCVVPVPLPNHPEGLVNHVTIHFMKWPMAMGGNCTREQRLRTIAQRMTPSKFYSGPLGYYLLTNIGILAPFLSKLRCLIPCTVMLSSFPGPEGRPAFKGLGVNVVDIIGGISPGSGSVGTSMLLISSNGKQRFTVTIDKTIFPSGQVFENLGRYIEDEIIALSTTESEFVSISV